MSASSGARREGGLSDESHIRGTVQRRAQGRAVPLPSRLSSICHTPQTLPAAQRPRRYAVSLSSHSPSRSLNKTFEGAGESLPGVAGTAGGGVLLANELRTAPNDETLSARVPAPHARRRRRSVRTHGSMHAAGHPPSYPQQYSVPGTTCTQHRPAASAMHNARGSAGAV